MAEILHFPDRNLLKLIDAMNGVLSDDGASARTAVYPLGLRSDQPT